ncbi:MAG: recombination regulator RecX [Oscillospiraceae bacterium]|jgi:regulatory protein|nr:recombination regulator RecX [Oscillospiraceae bacterium]
MSRVTDIQIDGRWVVIERENAEPLRVRKDIFNRAFNRASPAADDIEDDSQLLIDIASAEKASALEAALRYLASRARTTREIEAHLNRVGYHEEAIALAIDRLMRTDIVNDARYAEEWTRARTNRAIGASRIRQEMRRKGIPEDIIKAAELNADTHQAANAAVELARKTLRRLSSDEPSARKRKTIQTLARRGYSWEQAEEAYANAARESGAHEFHEEF